MRRPIALAAAAAAFATASLLGSGGCAYLLDSPFPPYVPLMVDQADVSGEMPYEQGAHYVLRVVGSPGGDYVWIYGEGSSFRGRFALYDADLDLVLKGENTDGTFWGESPLIFTASRFYIGRRCYDAATSARTSPDAKFDKNLGYYDASVSEFDFPYTLGTDDVTMWEVWTDPTTSFVTYTGPKVVGDAVPRNIEALCHDAAGGRLALYARMPGSNLLEGVVAPSAGFRSISTPLAQLSGAFTIAASSFDFDRPMFAGDGTVIRYYDDNNRLVYYDLKGVQGEELSIKDSGETSVGFSPEGGRWYIFDPRAGRITKARTWW